MLKNSFYFTKRYLFLPLFLAVISILIGFHFIGKFGVKADTTNLVTGCLSQNAGLFYNLKVGSSPLNPCPTGDPQIATGGPITSIIAGTGLTGGGTAGDITLGVANNGINTAQIASGAITSDKISNDASESSRVSSWSDTSTDYNISALGAPSYMDIPSSISITVPSGKAYYYIVSYDGVFSYTYSERNSGSSGFYASYAAVLMGDSTQLSTQVPLVTTGYRSDWSATGASAYWGTPFHATWLVRVPEGSYTLKLRVSGYSDNTMTKAHFANNYLQVLRVF